jgi:hypothetical protein
LPGSRYCGVDSHQALEGTGSDHVGGAPSEEATEAPAEDVASDAADLEPAPEAAARVPTADSLVGDVDVAEPADTQPSSPAGTGEISS